jgi:DNA-binding transcriptional MerR regulator/methylmalonyl-CoA mutase cobalamin-binding subunit
MFGPMDSEALEQPLHSVGVVCRRTGLKSDRLRAWERRYGVVAPIRSDGNQRLYRQEDIDRLLLLRQATDMGHRIAQIAGLSTESLQELVHVEGTNEPRAPRIVPTGSEGDRLVSSCLSAIQQLDSDRLASELDRAQDLLGPTAVLQLVITPLLHKMGELWADGGLGIAHEHLGTAVLRLFLQRGNAERNRTNAAPGILMTTLNGERHELGALLAAAAAISSGWAVTYLGPDVPAQQAAAAARQRGLNAVGISIVSSGDLDLIAAELATLRRHLGDDTRVIVGGRGARELADTLEEIGAVVVDDLAGLQAILAQITP